MSGRQGATPTTAPVKTAARGRKAVNRPKDRPGFFAKLEGVLDQPVWWDFTATIPAQSTEGHRRKMPEIVYLLFPSVASIAGSFSAAESALREPITWEFFTRSLCHFQVKYRPDDEPFDLNALLATTPVTAQNFYDARRSWLGPHMANLEAFFEKRAQEAALELGYANPEGRGSINHLVRERTVVADGKVTREPGSRYRVLQADEAKPALGIQVETHVVDTKTGEIVSAREMEGDAHLYVTGNGVAVGFKTVRATLRTDETNSTITLAVRRPQTKDEAACAVQLLTDLKQDLSGLLGVVYDAALRGTHIRQIARNTGLITVAPVAAKSTKNGVRVSKSGPVSVVEHERHDGKKCTHTFRYDDGRLFEQSLDSQGNKQDIAYPNPYVRQRSNKGGTYRVYLEWEITCAAGLAPGAKPERVATMKWTLTDDPKQRGFDPAENLRAVAPGTPEYLDAYGWRPSVENDNNQSDNDKFLRRSRSHRADWSHYNEIAWAIMRNGMAIQRKRGQIDQPVALSSPPGATTAVA